MLAATSLVLPLVHWNETWLCQVQENHPQSWRSGIPWLNLALCKESRLLIRLLRPQNVAKGRLCIILQHKSSSCFLISHPLLCNWFSWNLPRVEMAGYSFHFAFPLSHVQVSNAEMFPWLSHLGHALGLWTVKYWEILCIQLEIWTCLKSWLIRCHRSAAILDWRC